MATILPSPGHEQEINEEAEKLRTALDGWARQEDTKFEKKIGKLEECVDEYRWIYTEPFCLKVGLKKEVLREIELNKKPSD